VAEKETSAETTTQQRQPQGTLESFDPQTTKRTITKDTHPKAQLEIESTSKSNPSEGSKKEESPHKDAHSKLDKKS